MNKIYLLFLLALLPLVSSAINVVINDLVYNLDLETKTAQLSPGLNRECAGDVNIPQTVFFIVLNLK
jgi:hypothetical protein